MFAHRLAACGLVFAGSAAAGAGLDVATVPMNGVKGNVDMPLFGLGTWQYDDAKAEKAVEMAFSVGYRHVDTALLYGNQAGIGRALQKVMKTVPREKFFVTTKIIGGLNASATEAALDQCLKELNLEYIDLMLMHTPVDDKGKGSKERRQEQWKAMQEWALSGKARAIGVSHFCRHHIEDISSVSKVPIALNQVQYHVGMGEAPSTATDDKAYMEEKGIVYMSFSPLCGPCKPPHNKELRSGPLVTDIGKKYGKTGVQVSLKWLVQQGIPVIPKSSEAEHQKENMDLFDFTLSDADMKALTEAKSPPVGGGPSDVDSGDCSMPEDQFIVV